MLSSIKTKKKSIRIPNPLFEEYSRIAKISKKSFSRVVNEGMFHGLKFMKGGTKSKR